MVTGERWEVERFVFVCWWWRFLKWEILEHIMPMRMVGGEREREKEGRERKRERESRKEGKIACPERGYFLHHSTKGYRECGIDVGRSVVTEVENLGSF